MTTKIRIYELAKELKVDSKRIIEDLQRIGVSGGYVPSSSIDQAVANRVRERYNPNRASTDTPLQPTRKLVKLPSGTILPNVPPPSVPTTEPTTPTLSQPATGATGVRLIKSGPEAGLPMESQAREAASAASPAKSLSVSPVKTPASESTLRVVTLSPPPAEPKPVGDMAPGETPPAATKTAELKATGPKPAPTTSITTIAVAAPSAPVQPPNGGSTAAKPVPPAVPNQPVIRHFTVPTSRQVPPSRPSAAEHPAHAERTGGQPRSLEARPDSRDSRVARPPINRTPTTVDTTAPPTTRTTYVPPSPSQDRARSGRGRRGPKGRTEPLRGRDFEKSLNRPDRFTAAPPKLKPVFTELKPVTVVEGTTLKELAEKIDVKPKDIVAILLTKGIMATINQTLSEEAMREVAREFGYEVTVRSLEEIINDQQDTLAIETDALDDIEPRAPVVAVMGHVDHGKTSLLDAIRNTRVAAGEAGGITQHIGAYSVEVPDPDHREKLRRIVFLDTPGHEAFTMMRARGAKGADVAVIVVAADDGVMPQTIEAIDHARAAKVPIVVAINKIDKPQANVERVKKELSDIGLICEEWGGDTVMVEISAKHRRNLDALLEMILLTSDILDLKAPTKRLASGVVLEARLDKGRGPVASVLVQQGTLKVGDPFIVGLHFGRVRALIDDRGRSVTEAGPSVPVEVLGLEGVPKAGDLFQVVDDAARAQELANYRQSKARMAQLMSSAARGLEDMYQQMKSGQLKELLVILKADVQGSVEALRETLQKLSSEKVSIRVIRADVGAITESDVMLASASNDMSHVCIIIGFNVRPAPRVAELAKQERVDIRLHSVIYKVEEEVRKAMIGMLDPLTKEVELGRAEVRKVVKVPKVGNVAGCFVLEGLVKRAAKARLVRDSVVVYEGEIASLRRFKDDVAEVKSGFECGIGLDRFSDIKEGDIIECYTVEKYAAMEL
ncbi:translation initiation factor IF-2 [Chloracidobacterium thermophilum]|uniref:translation initiation factor IF-2 n=1 Tax=Chloracidobacterium thermophilum TaxID=458033 RepID=UPI000738AEE7|nr:translation initiation factor IF-2 [Chloracidobacterium thermophilum]